MYYNKSTKLNVGYTSMEKQTTIAFNKKIYLLGADAEGTKYWLEAPSWDCDWYWGFGYVETYTNNNYPNRSRDINSHQHFDSLFLNDSKVNAFDAFKEFFKETTLSEKEIWLLIDYMHSFYTLKKAAEVFGTGYSHMTEKAKLSEVQNTEMAKEINEKVLPAIFKQIDILLSDADNQQIGGDTN